VCGVLAAIWLPRSCSAVPACVLRLFFANTTPVDVIASLVKCAVFGGLIV